jgi:hypothetical protein
MHDEINTQRSDADRMASAQFDAGGALVTRYGPEDLNGPHHEAAFDEFAVYLHLARYRWCFPFLEKLTDADLTVLIERGQLQCVASPNLSAGVAGEALTGLVRGA